MNDKEYARTKRRIQKLADKWLGSLGLKWWSVSLVFSREALSVDDSDRKAGWYVNARVESKWEYMKAMITFNMPELEMATDEELERIFVHECCHILVNEMRMLGPETLSNEKADEAIKHEERVVCAMTSAFLWVRKDGAGTLAGAHPKRPRKKIKR